MKLGIIVVLKNGVNVNEEFKKLHQNGFETCQLICWDPTMLTDQNAEIVNLVVKEYGITITAVWAGWQAPAVWDFYDGQLTLGLVPEAYRFARAERVLEGASFAKKINVTDVITHVGFIPENPYDSNYHGVISTLRHICRVLKKNEQYFLFETGQETPITLLRAIEDIGTDNIGVNLDPANLLLYGKANPVDAVDILGKYIRGIHAKDGEYPTNGKFLGQEKPIGQGSVNFPAFIEKLHKVGYKGALTIENELHDDDNRTEPILASKSLLEKLILDLCEK